MIDVMSVTPQTAHQLHQQQCWSQNYAWLPMSQTAVRCRGFMRVMGPLLN